MPTYQYTCKACGHQLEELQGMSEPHLVHCPACNTDNLTRVIGMGAGLIFKGSGFYLTDYKKESSSTPGTSKPSKPASPATGSGDSAESSSTTSTPPPKPTTKE